MDWIITHKDNGIPQLEKEFSFRNFKEALAFVNKVGERAEDLDHHPDIYLHSYKKVRTTLTTHSEKSITSKDHQLALLIDNI